MIQYVFGEMYQRELIGEPNWHAGIFSLLILLFIFILLAVLITHHYSKHYRDESHTPRAMDIAEHRYAKGEISKAEFDQIKKDLS
jgi:uncharacterized membrane protein